MGGAGADHLGGGDRPRGRHHASEPGGHGAATGRRYGGGDAAAAGAGRGPGNEAWTSEGAVWTRRTLLRSSTFWLVVLAFGMSSMAMQGISLHVIPFIEEEGHTRLAAAGVFTAQT